MNEAPGSR